MTPHGTGDNTKSKNGQNIANLTPSTPPALADDLFENFMNSGVASDVHKLYFFNHINYLSFFCLFFVLCVGTLPL